MNKKLYYILYCLKVLWRKDKSFNIWFLLLNRKLHSQSYLGFTGSSKGCFIFIWVGIGTIFSILFYFILLNLYLLKWIPSRKGYFKCKIKLSLWLLFNKYLLFYIKFQYYIFFIILFSITLVSRYILLLNNRNLSP